MNRPRWTDVSAVALVALLFGIGAFLPDEIICEFVSVAGRRLHTVGFGLISFLIVVAFPARWRLFSAVALAAGGLMELLQSLAGRGAHWTDFTANAVGLVVGARWAIDPMLP